MVKKTQTAKNALHVSKNYAYLKPSVLRSMANDISGTRLEACKSYAVSRLPKIAVTATLASLLACGAGLPTHQAWANGFNLPDGSYRYANRDSSTKAQRYVDIKLVPCDDKQNDNKETADRKTYGQYYKVEYQFNSNGDWWGGRPFWWASVPKGVEIVDNKVNLYKDEQLTGGSASQQAGATYTKDSWNQSASRFWFDDNKEQGTEFKNNWERMTGEAGGYDESGDTLDTSKKYKEATSALIINWESRGNRKSKISFVIKLKDKTQPFKFAGGVYQVLGNWHYTVGKVELAPTLPEYSKELELTYPTDKVEVDSAKYGKNLSEDAKKSVLTKLWEANKSNADVLKKLKDMPETPTEEAFKQAVKVNNDGSATITYKDNSKDTISKENLTKRYVPLADRTKITYPDLTPVKNPTALDQSEKMQVENAIKNANSKIKDLIEKVDVAANGDATITFKDATGTHSTKKLEGKYLVKKQRSLADKFTPLCGLPIGVKNPSSLSPDDIKKVQDSIYDANKNVNGFLDAINNNKNNISIATNGDATITYKDNENSFPSKDTISHTLLVYKIPSLSERVKIVMPSRLGVKNAADLSTQEQNTIKDNIKKANKDLDQNLKKDANAINVGKDGTTTITFSDDSTVKIRGERLVYTQGKSTAQGTHKVTTGKYTYNITPIKVTNINNIGGNNWADAARRFMFDNYTWANKGTDFDKISHQAPLGEGGGKIASGYKWDLGKQVNVFSPINGTSGLSIDTFSKAGVNGIIHGDDNTLQIRGVDGWNSDAQYFSLSKDDLFYADGPAFNPEDEKKKIDDAIEKALKDKGFSGDELNKLKNEISKDKDVLSDKNGIKKQDDVDKLLKKIDELVNKKKEESDNKKQIDKAKKDLGLDDKQKKELDEQLKGVTDPEKIREKINEFQKDQDQKKQEEHNKQQQQADQQAEQEKQQQQQKDDAKVDTDIQTQNQQEQQDTGKAEEAKKTAELEKQKQAAIDEISNGEDYKNLTPDDKKQFIDNIQKAADENAINTIKQQAKEKATKNQNAADSSNKDGLDKAKTDAKKKIGELTNLNPQDKQKYQDEVDKADSLDKVAEILNKAEFDDAKAAAKKKITELKQNGDLTDQEATDLNNRIDKANDLREVEGILEEAELKKAKKDAKSEVDKLTNLNKAQKDALKAEIDDIETDPTNENMKTIEKVKGAITDVVTKAKELDKKMGDLKALVDLVKKQEEDLKKSDSYNDTSKKTAFDSALTNASTLVDTANGTNADGTKVDNIKKALEQAVNDLGGNTVDKSKLQDEIEIAYELQGKNKQGQDDSSKKKNPKYENASKDKKNDFDNALSNAKRVYDQKDASQQSINDAKDNLSKAIDALDGHDKSQLVAKLTEAKDKKNDVSYKNASVGKQTDLDNAITSAEDIVEKAGATAGDITNAITALTNAVTGLDGQDTSALQKAVNDANINKSKVAYKNADKDKRDNFDHALQAAQYILKNPQGKTEEAINDAKANLETASNALNGTVDTSKLQAEVNKANSLKKSVQYTNAVQDKKSAFDAALQQAESSLTEANNNQSHKSPEEKQKAVNDALQQLQTAAVALNGVDIADLQAEIALENSVKESVKYVYDTAEKQQTYNKALQDAKELISKLADPAGKGVEVAAKSQADRQALVNTALKSLKNAKDALNGVNKTVLQAEVDDDSRFSKSLEYSLGEPNDLDVYKKALAEAKRVLTDPNATQAQVDSALKDLQAAKNSIANKYSGSGTGSGTGSESGVGVNDNAPTTADKSELNIQIQNAESDSQTGNVGSNNADNAGANSGNASSNNADNTSNGTNSIDVNASVENNQAVKQADAQVSKAQAAVNTALAEAKRVLADPNATQAQVDAAVRNLSMARKALADAKSNAAKVRASVRSKVLKSGRADQLSNTGSNVSVFGLLAATISAAGAVLLGSRRRGAYRHSNK